MNTNAVAMTKQVATPTHCYAASTIDERDCMLTVRRSVAEGYWKSHGLSVSGYLCGFVCSGNQETKRKVERGESPTMEDIENKCRSSSRVTDGTVILIDEYVFRFVQRLQPIYNKVPTFLRNEYANDIFLYFTLNFLLTGYY